jgi:hypothetical protein
MFFISGSSFVHYEFDNQNHESGLQNISWPIIDIFSSFQLSFSLRNLSFCLWIYHVEEKKMSHAILLTDFFFFFLLPAPHIHNFFSVAAVLDPR